MIIEHLAVGPLACNCTIIGDREGGDAIVVDGGDEVDRIVAVLAKHRLTARFLVHTHAHFDHIGALGDLREQTGARGLLHHGDLPLYAMLREQALMFGLTPPRLVNLDADLREGETVRAGDVSLGVLHTPGHTPGSVTFSLERHDGTTLLTGDTLFRGAIGRWDLGGTSMEDIVSSIRSKILVYDDATVVVPGHGPSTTVGTERANNPFLV